jgi:hypothetical protein
VDGHISHVSLPFIECCEQQHSIFGAEKVTNEQFLIFFQLAGHEAISLRHMPALDRLLV